ncbi:ATP-binding protein [Nostoc sp. DedQUE09]|uniref:ATP-binding protein n=1 Tax=Nostoc sp. DedQUE09 TaxID=3075394 RepID=UPI002AD1D14E|nr:ATP-binding protein [Nostoc sp. DedQUE09]MDZ7955791.1 ATP-binding protein [Nostoc sp. DedQUE09]
MSNGFYRAVQVGEMAIVNDTNIDTRTNAKTCAALNIGAFIYVPLLRDGQWKFLFNGYDSRPRQWRKDEIDLFGELANQIFPRLERARAESAVAADLRDTQLLRELAARSVTQSDVQTLYQDLISAAIALTHADAGTIQLLDASTHELVLLAAQNLTPAMFEHFSRVDISSTTSCGIALRTAERTFFDFDVPPSEDPHGSCRKHVEAGYLSAQSTPLITRSGRAIGMISTHWRTHYRPSDRELRFLDLLARQAADLIEQRQAAAEGERLLQQTQTARAEAEQANRVKDEFLAVLSHELRTPLNPILGWTQLLQGGKLDATRQREGLAAIERNAKLQTQLIEDLLDISRIIQGKLSLTAACVNLKFVITAAVETVRLAAEAKQIQIFLDLTTEIAPISGDAARLQQLVWNLLTNAVKFTPNGGRVMVELRQIDGLATIRVIDTGKGIDSQFLPHVFDYFRQADSSTTRKFGGLGLGLALVRQIVEMHGGIVKAQSLGEDQGATFTVQLPMIQPIVPTLSQPSQAKAENLENSLSNRKILVVDDEADTRDFQAFLLQQSGARVIAVDSGLEALQIFDQFIPDILVSDVGMAQMDGYMLIQRIRSRPPGQGGKVPAIALTAYARDFDRHKAFQSGFQAHITKPIEPAVLIQTITSLLKHNRF